MKIVTVVGARPQFIKAAMLSRHLRKFAKEIIVHTGQHYDDNMSRIFFTEMAIPKPDYNLGIANCSHGEMTGKMIIGIEKILMNEKPDAVLLYGDTNSTLAAALAAVKLHLPVIHVEAGNRLHTLDNPEEINRICTDHVSRLRFCCVVSGIRELKKENIANDSYLVGDLMYDAFLHYSALAQRRIRSTYEDISGTKIDFDLLKEKYYLLTCHREENSSPEVLKAILAAMDHLPNRAVFLVHPRNIEKIQTILEERSYANILFLRSVGYLESLAFVNNCERVVTDSGGLQREAFFAHKPCVTLLDFVAWPETMHHKNNQLCRPVTDEILRKITVSTHFTDEQPFGDGKAAAKIAQIIKERFGEARS